MRVVAAFLVNTLFNFVIGLLVAKFLGPDQFGRFALAAAVGMMIQTIAFEWLRLSAVRFYSARVREQQPEVRATMDAAFAVLALGLAAVAIVWVLSGVELALSPALVALAFCAAIANGLFDYHTALVRARFHDRLYAGLVILKNAFALVLTTGGAYVYGSAAMTLAGACVAMVGSVFLARRALSDLDARPNRAQWALTVDFARYSGPIIIANVLYLAIPLANRSLATALFGFSETGQFSLSFDIGTRLIAAVGSALDVLLFQMAVRADELHGRARARAQVAQNMAVVFAILVPAAAGLWLILPSLEALIVPQEFRGPFARYLTLLLPGMLCFGLMNFALNPVFQIGKRTMPVIAAAVAACIANPLILIALPATGDASTLALAQSGAFAVALAVLAGFAAAGGAQWPRFRDIAATLLATLAMAAVLWPMRDWQPGAATLAGQIGAGAGVFAVLAGVFDLAGLRTAVRGMVARRMARGTPGDNATSDR